MARARNIKPGFFKNEQIAELAFEQRLLFIGLWTIADREGRLEDRPKRIKMEIFPADNVDIDAGLKALEASGFIRRYEVGASKLILIHAFKKHQHPHFKEAQSTLPAPLDEAKASGSVVMDDAKASGSEPINGHKALDQPHASPSDSLIPDSLQSDSLQKHSSKQRTLRVRVSELSEGFLAFWEAWPVHKRKTDRPKCWSHWLSQNLEPQTSSIVAAVKAWKVSDDWLKEGGNYIPAPIVWLRREAYSAPAPVPIRSVQMRQESAWFAKGGV